MSSQQNLFEDGKIVVKSIFGIIVSLDISDCFLKVQNLPTFSGWGGTTYMRWLCVYQKNRKTPIFHTGCSNKKKYKRIQIIYSEKNSIILSQCFESNIKN